MRNASSAQTFSAKAGGSTPESEPLTRPGPPIAIFHYDINKDLDGYVPAAPSLLYFWLEDRPVGHIWLLTPHQIPQLRDAAASTIDVEALLLARREASAEWRSSLSTTVVICTRDRPDALRRCLASLQNQTRQADQMLVVDNASKDENVRDIAREAGADYLREERLGLDHARNAGALAALGDIVLFTDDDVEPHPRWLECMTNSFDADHVAAVTGLVLPAELKTAAQQHFERFWSFGRGYRRVDFGQDFFASDRTRGCPAWEIGAGASMAFRRRVFDEVGLFDERLDVGAAGCSGDSEYWHRLLSAGWTCRYDPSAVSFHYHRRDDAALARQLRAYMRGHAAALLVQFERTGHLGNLRRALIYMPVFYIWRVVRFIAFGTTGRDQFLGQEIAGYIAGILYYLRAPRPRRAPHAGPGAFPKR
jgi:GT2 family glycosyltransferase